MSLHVWPSGPTSYPPTNRVGASHVGLGGHLHRPGEEPLTAHALPKGPLRLNLRDFVRLEY